MTTTDVLPTEPDDPAGGVLLSPGARLRRFYVGAIGLFAVVVPLVFAVGVWVWVSNAESQREIKNYLQVRAIQIKNDIEAWIGEEFEVLGAIGATLNVEDARDDSWKTLDTVQQTVHRWKVIALYDADTGEMLRDTLGIPRQAQRNEILRMVRQVAEARKPGLCTCFIKGNKTDPFYGIHIFVPIFKNGAVRYVFSAVLEYDVIQRMVMTSAAPFYDVAIIDEHDLLVARSNRKDGFRGREVTEPFKLHAKGLEQAEGVVSGPTYTGNISTGAFSHSPLTDWYVFTGTGADNYNVLTRQTRWALFAIICLCLILIAMLCIMVLYNMVLNRINAERMTAAAAFGKLQTQLLTSTNDALNKQSKAASEREVLLREIYHRVKNNLQIIQSLMRLGARDLNREQQEPFDAAARRIGAMARVHTLLYNSPDLSSIDLGDYLSGIVSEISESFGAASRNIGIHVDLQSMRVPIDTAIPLAFISVELLTNAFKHAFPDNFDGGEVTVVSRREGEEGLLLISDNGIGVPAGNGRRKTLGLKLVDRLVEQINGTLHEPADGKSEYRIVFPLVQPHDEADCT